MFFIIYLILYRNQMV